ncbi:unnamed protein product [Trichobilharzia regenti]|nr:unnamed protein product [Trichobilharzia regenti]
MKPFYDNPDSTFPTRLVCLDVNPEYDSSISLTSSSMSQEKISVSEFCMALFVGTF